MEWSLEAFLRARGPALLPYDVVGIDGPARRNGANSITASPCSYRPSDRVVTVVR